MKIIVGFVIALLIFAVLYVLGVLNEYVEDRFKHERDYELNMEYFMHSVYNSHDIYEILLDGIITVACIILALTVFYILGDMVLSA